MMREPPCEPEQCPEWVKLGRKLDDRAQSAFPTIKDIVVYGHDGELGHALSG